MTYPIIEDKVYKRETQEQLIDVTVSKMWDFINRDSNNIIIKNRAKTLKRNTVDETIKATFDYLVSSVPYCLDPQDMEQLTAPIHYESKYQYCGDCDDMVMYLGALLLANNIKVRIKVLAWRRDDFTHVVLEAWNNYRWLDLDGTMNFLGYDVIRQKINKLPNKPIYTQYLKSKIYENPMELKIRTLSDSPGIFNSLNDCGCSHSTLNDCGCSKCKKKRELDNNNYNINIIPIGNSLDWYNKQTSNPNTNVTNKNTNLDQDKEIVKRIVEKQKNDEIQHEIVRNDNIEVETQKVDFVPKVKKMIEIPVTQIRTKNGQTYTYEIY